MNNTVIGLWPVNATATEPWIFIDEECINGAHRPRAGAAFFQRTPVGPMFDWKNEQGETVAKAQKFLIHAPDAEVVEA